MTTDDMETVNIGTTNLVFSHVSPRRLEDSTEWTLATICVDTTGSTHGFATELRQALIDSIKMMKESPRKNYLLVRVLLFSTIYPDNVLELHGFKMLADIDANDYPEFNPDGMTPLKDITFSALGAMVEFGENLTAKDYTTNGIGIIITDGYDNQSNATMGMITNLREEIRRQEKLESCLMLLVGVNAARYKTFLDAFKTEAGFDDYMDIGDWTPQTGAKLAGWVEASVSSQSQHVGTGGPSKAISATI
ncbi:MAG: hypothetical protein ACR2QC_01610 [Gammaproteobacteria bacterium]